MNDQVKAAEHEKKQIAQSLLERSKMIICLLRDGVNLDRWWFFGMWVIT